MGKEIDGDKYKYDKEIVELEKSGLKESFKEGAKDGSKDLAYNAGKAFVKFAPFLVLAVFGYRYLKTHDIWLFKGVKKYIKDQTK